MPPQDAETGVGKARGLFVTTQESSFGDLSAPSPSPREELEPFKELVLQVLAPDVSHDDHLAWVRQLKTIEERELEMYFAAMAQCVSSIKKEMTELTDFLFSYSLCCNDQTFKSFGELMLNLLSAKTSFVEPALRSLVKGFYAKKPDAVGNVFSQDLAYHRIHQILEHVVKLIPMGTTCLVRVIVECFPHRRQDVKTQESYLRNILMICQYVPDIVIPILSTIVDHLIQIDVEIRLDEMEEEDFVFEVELEEGMATGSLTPGNHDTLDVMAEKLDVMMSVVFEFLHTHMPNQPLFMAFLDIFDRYILNTYKSKYTQFLVFYMCSTGHIATESFLEHLCQRLFDERAHGVVRQACAAYVASFIARAKFVSEATVNTAMRILVSWLHDYINARDTPTTVPDPEAHQIFYSVVQAVCYIVCYQSDVLLAGDGKVSEFKETYNLQRIVKCKLSPLQLCADAVSNEFARLLKLHGVMDCSDYLRRSVKLKVSARQVYEKTGVSNLEMFFPFDPYLLRKSSRYINTQYREWSAADSDAGYSSDDEEDDEVDSDSDDGDDGLGSWESMRMTPDDHNLNYHKMRLKKQTDRAKRSMSRSPSYSLSMSC
eukprot:GFYU01008008.1.p1 GENE.GFYU01008008.1~~GFYU01008008.1.p1  ORF type:complete len:600 (-),score=158.22 GFYU01008008.1:254-2053(-)